MSFDDSLVIATQEGIEVRNKATGYLQARWNWGHFRREGYKRIGPWTDLLFSSKTPKEVRLSIARHRECPNPWLERYALSYDLDIRRAVANNPSSKGSALDLLLGEKDLEIQFALANHKNLSLMSRKLLMATTSDEGVRNILLQRNTNTYREAVKQHYGKT